MYQKMVVQVLLAGHCVAQSVDPGPIRVGDRWAYDVKDEVTGDLRHAVTIGMRRRASGWS